MAEYILFWMAKGIAETLLGLAFVGAIVAIVFVGAFVKSALWK